ncbi:MAG: helix-turn-helix domain-containing protein [Carboxylicivirga sp.]|jgi:excisionase family DNA binding protein|nr:helix-turn-helix domain-containing protein [Carboxylicivirga sp.]
MRKDKQSKQSPFMTSKEAMEYLCVGRTTLYKWAQQGIITVYKIGNANRYKRAELDAAIKPVKPLL